jgi:hypothetical protein
MKEYLDKNGWSMIIAGIGSFLCFQLFQMKSDVSEIKVKIDYVQKDIVELKTDAKSAYIRFDKRHEDLSNKIGQLEK